MSGPLGKLGLDADERQASARSAGAGSGRATPASGSSSDFDIGALEEIIGFHIRLAHGATYRHFTETFAELGLTQKMVSVLWLIDDHPHIAQADIGRHLQMDRATTMAIINRLEARGLLVRGESKRDRRRQTLTLTHDGYEALLEARRCINEHEQWVRSRFTKREAALLIELLQRIHE